jgi:hypothetical protein
MNEDREQDRSIRRRATQKRPPEWRQDLNPERPPGQNAGQVSDARVNAEWTAFHLRKRGHDPGAVNATELRQESGDMDSDSRD